MGQHCSAFDLKCTNIWRTYTGLNYMAFPRLRESCRQVEAEVVTNSRNKFCQTWEWPFRDSLYYCSCLPVLPGPAWVLLSYVLHTIISGSVLLSMYQFPSKLETLEVLSQLQFSPTQNHSSFQVKSMCNSLRRSKKCLSSELEIARVEMMVYVLNPF